MVVVVFLDDRIFVVKKVEYKTRDGDVVGGEPTRVAVRGSFQPTQLAQMARDDSDGGVSQYATEMNAVAFIPARVEISPTDIIEHDGVQWRVIAPPSTLRQPGGRVTRLQKVTLERVERW